MNHYLLSAAVAISVVSVAVRSQAADFFFKTGDRVVVMGDSITEQHLYSTYLESWALTRFPSWDLTFINVGISGDGAPGGNNRFKRDVLAFSATAMTIDFGMNDAGGNFENFMKNMQGIADQAAAAKIRVAWCSPQACENPDDSRAIDTAGNHNLEKFTAGVKQTAAANGNSLFVDQFHPYLEFINKARPTNPKIRVGGGDQVHPGPPGQTLMAATILQGMNFPPMVAAVEINATATKVVQSQNCTIDALKVDTDGSIRFSQLDKALPYFPEGDAKKILEWLPILEQMNDYRLKVSGLKAGRYDIRHGGVKIAEHSAAELAAGVNLAAAAMVAGPIAEQLKAVNTAISAKNSYFHDKIFSGVLRAGGVPEFMEMTNEQVEAKRTAVFQERMKKMPELFATIKTSLTMKAHPVEIVRLPDQ
jgi:lysophospholipase L1-like esterase